MSEESTHDSDGEVVVHKHTPPFRSEGESHKLLLMLLLGCICMESKLLM